MQFLMNERNQLIEGSLVALSPLKKQRGDGNGMVADDAILARCRLVDGLIFDARCDDRRRWSLRDPRLQFRHVNAERTVHPRADEVARSEFAITQDAFDSCLGQAATRTLMQRHWRGDLGS
jgi:hypothetical protein